MFKSITLAAALSVSAFIVPAAASNLQVGVLQCDVSKGTSLFVEQKQSMRCVFKRTDGTTENYRGRIKEYGLSLGNPGPAHLVWGVFAPSQGLPKGALAGGYGGVTAGASLGVGMGANVLVGGLKRSFSLQPISMDGMQGTNLALGVANVSLWVPKQN
jgi:Protein of unknown function (DUF992)